MWGALSLLGLVFLGTGCSGDATTTVSRPKAPRPAERAAEGARSGGGAARDADDSDVGGGGGGAGSGGKGGQGGGIRSGQKQQGNRDAGYTLMVIKDAKERLAVCNNGEPATYFVRPGKEGDRDKFILYFRGGGACADAADCKRREKQAGGFMVPYARHRGPNDAGILSFREAVNPDFHSWTKVYVPYCSSDLFIGDRGASKESFGYHFRGSRIVKAIIEDLKAHKDGGLASATQVIVIGGSAGARGVHQNLDRIAGWLPNARVVGLSDSGATPSFVVDGKLDPEDVQRLKGGGEPRAFPTPADHPWNPVLDDDCVETLDEAWTACIRADSVDGLFVDTPMFVYKDQNDVTSLEREGIQPKSKEAAEFARRIRSMLERWKGGGVYSTRRGTHVLTNVDNWNALPIKHTDGKSYTMAEVFGNWYFDRPGPKRVIQQ